MALFTRSELLIDLVLYSDTRLDAEARLFALKPRLAHSQLIFMM